MLGYYIKSTIVFLIIYFASNRAIKTLLHNRNEIDYKRVLKENEHKTEKIENQKAELAILNEKQKDFNKLQNTLKSYKGQFRRQEKENEKLKNQEATARKINELLVQRYSNSIPVQKVKDNIKKLEIKKEKARGERDILERFAIEKSINSLQELLESEE